MNYNEAEFGYNYRKGERQPEPPQKEKTLVLCCTVLRSTKILPATIPLLVFTVHNTTHSNHKLWLELLHENNEKKAKAIVQPTPQ